MSEAMMLFGILMILFCSMGYYSLIKVESELALAYSSITLIAILHICGKTCGLKIGTVFFCVLSIAGFILFLVREKQKKQFFSFGISAFTVLSIASMLAFHGDFIQTYDDFHQWAAEVKYMFIHNMIPIADDFIGVATVPPETSLFSAFFQILGGYNEGNMLASSFMLTAIAVVLPLMGLKSKDNSKGIIYLVLVYFGFFSLYNQPYKSLYVDLPCAIWAASACLVWMFLSFENNKGIHVKIKGKPISSHGEIFFRNILMILPLLVFVSRIKWGVGLLMWLFTLGYIVLTELLQRPSNTIANFLKRKWKQALVTFVIFISLIIVVWYFVGQEFIPASFSGIIEALTFSSEKARLTASTMYETLFKKSVTSNPNMPFKTVQATILTTIVLFVLSTWEKSERLKKSIIATAFYYPICVFMYAVGLYVSYVSVFSYEESIKNATGYRYMSIVVLFGFMLMAGYILTSSIGKYSDTNTKKTTSSFWNKQVILGLLLVLLMASNINSKIIYKGSSLRYWKNNTYEPISTTKDQIDAIKCIITDSDKVYLISNAYSLENMNEYPLCVALYYMDSQVSNYMRLPWKYTEEGSLTFVQKTDVHITELNNILISGGYTYIWIHSYDDYLRDRFKEMYDCTIDDNGLYKINYLDGGAISLELVQQL